MASSKGKSRKRTRPTESKSKATKSSTILIRGARVVTMDDQDRVARLDIKIESDRITALGEKISSRGVGRVVDAKGMVVIPGLVQPHLHLCQTLFRAQAEEMDLLTWLHSRVWPLEGALEARDMRAAVRLGMTELLLGGTTSILDMGTVRHGDILFEEAERSGIRYAGGKAIMDHGQGYPSGLRETAEEALVESVRLCRRWHGEASGRLRYAFSPRFALSCSELAIRGCVIEARKRGALLHSHVAESSEEVGLVRDRTGMGNFEYLHSLGFAGPDVLLAHGIWLSGVERRLLRETGTRIVHCPSANLKLASGIARVAEMLDDEILVAISADGAACNNTLDAFVEMRLAALIHKARGGPGALPARTVLRMGTKIGATALGLDDVGSIEVGKKADLTLLDFHRPHLWPDEGDLVARIIFAARSSDVHTVLIDGQFVVEEAKLCSGDVDKILRNAQAAAKRVTARVD